MSQMTTLNEVRVPSVARGSNAERLFYVGVALLLLMCALGGFHWFYLHGKAYPGREIGPPVRAWVIAHGVSMTLWMLLLVVQPVLIAMRRPRLHRALGKAGAALAALVVVLGLQTAVGFARHTPPEATIWGLNARRFFAVPLIAVFLFGLLVGVAIWKRRNPVVHRDMMILATLAALTAALNRIDWMNNLYIGTVLDTIFGPFLPMFVIGLLILGGMAVVHRRFDRVFAGGLVFITAACALVMPLARTDAWERFVTGLVG